MENAQIADIFDEIGDLLDLQGGNQFRIRSYRNAARTVRDLSRRLEDMVEEGEDLSKLPSIGASTAEKIHEILDRGTCRRLEELRGEVPEGLTQVMRVPSLGPRKSMLLYKELGIESLEDLEKAASEGRIRDLGGMGPKTEQNILEGLQTLAATSGRFLYQEAAGVVESLGRHLDGIDAIERWEVAGSFRRRRETVGDLDILIRTDDRDGAADAILEYGAVSKVDSRGQERVTVHLENGVQVDFRFFEPEAFGAALMYFTGSKAHNIELRKIAQDRGWKLNEYGIFKDGRRLAGKDEESVYHRLNLAWTPPELRENRGEVKAAAEDGLPDLIEPAEIRGDLQCHTDATDGNNTIDEMVEAARQRGYQYIAITDHSKAVRVANGLDEDALKEHVENIRKADETHDDIWVMAGVEVDILKSGKLDLDEDLLAELDWVMASVHYNRKMERDQMTERLLAGLRSGVVHCLAHPLGRIIGQRDPIAFDFEKLLEACRDNNVLVEINAQPDRLDLPDTHCREATEAGVGITISTDAHKTSDLDFMRLGVYVARRGWLEKRHVLNTLTARQLRKRIGDRT